MISSGLYLHFVGGSDDVKMFQGGDVLSAAPPWSGMPLASTLSMTSHGKGFLFPETQFPVVAILSLTSSDSHDHVCTSRNRFHDIFVPPNTCRK